MLNEQREILDNLLYKKNSLMADLSAISEYKVEPNKIKNIVQMTARLDSVHHYIAQGSLGGQNGCFLSKAKSADWVTKIINDISEEQSALIYFNTASFALRGDISALQLLIVTSSLFFNRLLAYSLVDHLPINMVSVGKNQVVIKHIIYYDSCLEKAIDNLQLYFLTGDFPDKVKGDMWKLDGSSHYDFLNKDVYLLYYLHNLAKQFNAKIDLNKINGKEGRSVLSVEIKCKLRSVPEILTDDKNDRYIYMECDFVNDAVYWLNIMVRDNFVALREWGDFCTLGEKSFVAKVAPTVYVDCVPYITESNKKIFSYSEDLIMHYSSCRDFNKGLSKLCGNPISNSLVIVPYFDRYIREKITDNDDAIFFHEDFRVLVVDDNMWHQNSLKAKISNIADVVAVDSAEDALDLLQSDQFFDLIVLDHGLPGMQGQDFMDNRSAAVRCIPVMLNTAHVLSFNTEIKPRDYVRCLSKGTSCVLTEVKEFLHNLKK